MRRTIAILTAFLLIASGMHISIDRHFCGGTLAGVKVSVTGKLASCGMEEVDSRSGNQPVFDKKCCEDQVSDLNILNNCIPEYSNTFHTEKGKEIFPARTDNNITFNSISTYKDIRVLPPGENLDPRLTQPGLCLFRI
jgi:hypothetical protein